MSSKKTFFVKVNKKGEIDTKQSAKDFADFLSEDTTPVNQFTKEEQNKVEIAETVFDMFEQLEEEIESRKTSRVEEEVKEEPIVFDTQQEVDGFNELSEVLFSDDVAGTMIEQLTGEKLELDNESFDGLKTDPPQAVLQDEIELAESVAEEVKIQLDESDPMSKYVDRIRVSNSATDFYYMQISFQ